MFPTSTGFFERSDCPCGAPRRQATEDLLDVAVEDLLVPGGGEYDVVGHVLLLADPGHRLRVHRGRRLLLRGGDQVFLDLPDRAVGNRLHRASRGVRVGDPLVRLLDLGDLRLDLLVRHLELPLDLLAHQRLDPDQLVVPLEDLLVLQRVVDPARAALLGQEPHRDQLVENFLLLLHRDVHHREHAGRNAEELPEFDALDLVAVHSGDRLLPYVLARAPRDEHPPPGDSRREEKHQGLPL
jgi:hypothetical protein